jgi:hypothetical protein
MASLELGRGAVSPLSLSGCRSLLEKEVLDLEWITTNAGVLTVGVRIRVGDLLEVCDFEIVSLT